MTIFIHRIFPFLPLVMFHSYVVTYIPGRLIINHRWGLDLPRNEHSTWPHIWLHPKEFDSSFVEFKVYARWVGRVLRRTWNTLFGTFIVSENVWECLRMSENIWKYLRISEDVWECLRISENVWEYLRYRLASTLEIMDMMNDTGRHGYDYRISILYNYYDIIITTMMPTDLVPLSSMDKRFFP